MERLTEWIWDGESKNAVPKINMKNNGHAKCTNRLAEYEDAEEQGLLLRLPCSIGTPIFVIGYHAVGENGKSVIKETWIDEYEFDLKFIDCLDRVFLTREEAEAKLEEMRCKNG